MMNWFLKFLEKRGRKAVIMDRENKDPYLERYYVLHADSVDRERKDIPFNVLIHRFMQSDDPVFHDHPWNWSFSLILKGGYWEHTPEGKKWRGVGSFKLMIPHDNDVHWIEIPESGKTWSLFIRGRTTHDWGFIEKENNRPPANRVIDGELYKWTIWKEYLETHRKS